MIKEVIIEIYGEPEDPVMIRLREELRMAMQELEILPFWKEYFPNSYNIPSYFQNNNQPSLAINGALSKVILNKKTLPDKEKIKEEIHRLDKEYINIKKKKKYGMQTSFLLNMFVAFFPKCPFCWAAYLSLLGLAGTSITYKPWMLPLAILLLVLNLASMYFSKNRHQLRPFWLSVIGTLLIISNRLWFDSTVVIILAGTILVFASIWNALPKRMAISINYYINSIFKLTENTKI